MRRADSKPHNRAGPMAGFTLIEVLVASAILALMDLVSWRGLEGLSKAQVALQNSRDDNPTSPRGFGRWRVET